MGGTAPSFTVQPLDGGSFRFPTGKPTAIFFSASTCGSCLPKAAAFGWIRQQFGDKVAVLGVDIDPNDTMTAFRRWIDSAGNPPISFAMDDGSQLVRAFDVKALSTVVITDAFGRVVFRSFLEDGEQTLRDALSRAGLA